MHKHLMKLRVQHLGNTSTKTQKDENGKNLQWYVTIKGWNGREEHCRMGNERTKMLGLLTSQPSPIFPISFGKSIQNGFFLSYRFVTLHCNPAFLENTHLANPFEC